MAGEVVRIRNVNTDEKATFRDGYDGTMYEIPVGEERVVPLDAAVLWLGDPSSVDYGPERRDRLAEYTRLRVRYGAYENDYLWEQNKPHLEVFSIQDNTKLGTVLEDPTGEAVTPETQTKLENRLLSDRLAMLEQELKNLQAVAAQNPANAPTGDYSTTDAAADATGTKSGETTANPSRATPFGSGGDQSRTDKSSTISNATSDKVNEGDIGEDDSIVGGDKGTTDDTPSKIGVRP